MCELLKAYTCCFAWDYTEMLGLSRGLELQAKDHRKGERKGGSVAASQVHTAV
jgi:hypothetical protein